MLTSLISSAVVPLTVLTFTLDLPLLGPSPPLGTLFLLGTGFLVVGLGLYNSAPKSGPAAASNTASSRAASASESIDLEEPETAVPVTLPDLSLEDRKLK